MPILCFTGNQWSRLSTRVIWSRWGAPVTSRATASCTDCAFLQTADIWASNVSLESRITPRVVTLSVVGKTEDAIETSQMIGNDCIFDYAARYKFHIYMYVCMLSTLQCTYFTVNFGMTTCSRSVMLGYTESEYPRLISRGIIFEILLPTQRHKRTDGRTTCRGSTALLERSIAQ